MVEERKREEWRTSIIVSIIKTKIRNPNRLRTLIKWH